MDTGRISVDRSTKATLNTYNTWSQLSRLQMIYRSQHLKLRLPPRTFNGKKECVCYSSTRGTLFLSMNAGSGR